MNNEHVYVYSTNACTGTQKLFAFICTMQGATRWHANISSEDSWSPAELKSDVITDVFFGISSFDHL